MRETRLYDFATVQEEQQFEIVNISASRNTVKPSDEETRSWAGLAGNTITWRVEEGNMIVFEHIVTRAGVKLFLSSPISCQPFFPVMTNSSDDMITFLIVCSNVHSGCTLLCMRIHKSLRVSSGNSSCEEFARVSIPNASITTLADINGDAVVGLNNGTCGIVDIHEQPLRRISVRVFDPSLSKKTTIEPNDTGSVVSAGSDASSFQSVRSSRSLGLITRMFRSPSITGKTTEMVHGTGNSVDVSQLVLNSQKRDRNRGKVMGYGDSVLAISKMNMDTKTFVSLHASGRLCAYTYTNDSYQFISDIVLPVKLSSRATDNFLITGTAASVIAVVLADEDPGADSLRVFNVAARSTFRHIVLSCTQIAKREGPVGHIVSAVFCGDDVIVGTEDGQLSGLLHLSSEIDTGSGIPTETLWTIPDDLDKPYGISKAISQAFTSPQQQLLLAHYFSSYALARALRLKNPELSTRSDISEAIKGISPEEWAEGKHDRIKTRAEQVMKLEESKIRALSIIDGGAVAVIRGTKVNVLRGLFDSEKSICRQFGREFNQYSPDLKGIIAHILSSHAVCQDLTCQMLNVQGNDSLRDKLVFMLTIATKFSERISNTPLLDVIMRRRLSKASLFLPDLSFHEVVNAVIVSLAPGSVLLKTLFAISETSILGIAAEKASNNLPISSMFSSGLSWLAKFQTASIKSRDQTTMNMADEQTLQKIETELQSLQETAYGFLITATRWCDTDEGNREEDLNCVMTLAGLSLDPSRSASENRFSSRSQMVPSTPVSHLPSNISLDDIKEHLGFWLLERAVRLFEAYDIPRSAAAAALEAMNRAPDRERLEMMRAAAFSKFLDAGDLDAALTAILSRPFTDEQTYLLKEDESGALRDALNLFVNAVADQGQLQWLAARELPEPLRMMCGHALERRARSGEPFKCTEITPPSTKMGFDLDMEQQKEDEKCDHYKLLYCWQLLRSDEASAATAALEWAGRLSQEGLAIVRAFSNDSSRQLSFEQQMKALLQWTKAKSTALTYAMSAARLQPSSRQYIVRSRFAVLSEASSPSVVDISWVSRRQLLAHGQIRCLKKLISEGNGSTQSTQTLHYLSASGSPFLSEQREGVSWVVSTLTQYPSYDDLLLCVELGIAWSAEVGDSVLAEVIKAAARLAVRREVEHFNFSELADLLKATIHSSNGKHPLSKWYLIAIESALEASAEQVVYPQWLLNAAAWGIIGDEDDGKKRFAGCKHGDAVGVVRVFLRNSRLGEAADILIAGLESIQSDDFASGVEYVPFATIDATLEALAQLADTFPKAAAYENQLKSLTEMYIKSAREKSEWATANPQLEPSRAEGRMTSSNMDIVAV